MIRKLTLFLVFGIFAFRSEAQIVMSLQDCIEAALENSIEMRRAKLGAGFAEIDYLQAKHNRYPSLSASSTAGMNFGRFVNPITDAFINESFFSNSIGLNSGVNLFNGFQISNAIKQTRAARDASDLDVEQIKRDVALSVANNYLAVLFADENLAIAKSQLDVSKGQLSQTSKLIEAGVRPANAIYDIQAQVASNEQQTIAAENSKTIALLNLKQQMRMEPNTELQVVIPDDISVLSDPDDYSLEEIYKKAYLNQPSMRAVELRQKSAELGVKIAKGALLPSLSAGAGVNTNYGVVLQDLPPGIPPQKSYRDQINENLSANIGLQLSIPIYQNYRNQLGVQRAKLNALNTTTEKDLLVNQLMVTLQQALTDAKAAKRKLVAAQKSESAQQANFENAQKMFNQGTINSFEFLSIQNSATQAKVNHTLAHYEYVFAMKVIDFYMGEKIVLD